MKLINAKFLLRCALFTDVLIEAKHFSLITQEQNIDIICILDSVENTTHNYNHLLKILWKNPAYVFQLPTVKFETEEIKSNDEDGEPMYQNQKVQFYSREKCFIEDIVQIIETVVSCFEKRYGILYSNLEETSIFDVCYILNCDVWPWNVMRCYTEDDVLSSFLVVLVMYTNTLILLTLTQLNFGARFFLSQMNTFLGNPQHW